MTNDDHVDGDRYHRKTGFPEDIELPTGIMMLYSTPHARKEAQNDRFGSFDLPTRQDIEHEMYRKNPDKAIADEGGETETHIFEITVEDGEVTRFALRKHHDEERDKILIINPDDEHTVTAWSNMKDDKHDTLDTSVYEKPENRKFEPIDEEEEEEESKNE